MIKLSIIIPVYNSERNIEKCINSLLNQTYKDFELIIINDGSIDNSYKVINSLIKGKNNIYLYNQTNQGVSAARNLGISKAKGEYISFIDSDDYVDNNYVKELISKVNNNQWDCVITGISFISKSQQKKIIYHLENKEWTPQTAEEWISFFKTELLTSPVAKLYKKEIIKKYNIKFNPQLSFAEDRDFNISFLVHTNRIFVCSYYGYNYNTYIENSLSKKKHSSKLYNDYIYWNKLYQHIRIINNGYYSDSYLANLLYNFTIDNYIELFRNYSIMDCYKSIEKSKKYYNEQYLRQNLKIIKAPRWQKITFYINHYIFAFILFIIAKIK